MADEPQDSKALNKEAEDKIVAAQWEQAKRLGLLEQHGESINAEKPKE